MNLSDLRHHAPTPTNQWANVFVHLPIDLSPTIFDSLYHFEILKVSPVVLVAVSSYVPVFNRASCVLKNESASNLNHVAVVNHVSESVIALDADKLGAGASVELHSSEAWNKVFA